MTIKETFVCPVCGCATKTSITNVNVLTEDVRYDTLECGECGSIWRVYFKETNMSSEVVFTPSKDENVQEDSTPEVEVTDNK